MREGIAEAYVGIVQGLKASDRGRSLFLNRNAMPFIVKLPCIFLTLLSTCYFLSTFQYTLAAQLITPYAHQIFAFLEAATAQEDRTESVTRSILGLIGYAILAFRVCSMQLCFTKLCWCGMIVIWASSCHLVQ